NFTIEIGYEPELSEIEDSCITEGVHNVLRFDFLSKNIGDTDFVAGRPVDRPDLVYYHVSHQHYHMRQFNQYKLYDKIDYLVIPSTKPGFCLDDSEEERPNVGPAKFPRSCLEDEV